MCKPATPKIHPFESAGLGKAPFRYIGCYEDRGPHRTEINGVEVCIGSPGQPMGTCSYCGQGIAICCRIESADGKKFTVGSDCVMKVSKQSATTDVDRALAVLAKQVRNDINARERERRHAREAVKVAEGRAWLDANRLALEAMPNPKRDGETLWDQAEWFWAHAGTTGKLSIVQALKAKVAQ